MEVAVLTCGVADPKWPLPKDLTLAALRSHAAQYATLSPFDEAALEVALALRDADPALRITAFIAADEPLARRVAGWRPDALHRIDLGDGPRWDGDVVAQTLAVAVGKFAPAAGLVLIGREFGDYDDGSVPAAMAHHAGLPYLPLALNIRRTPQGLSVLRQGSGGLERVQLSARAVLSVTNDPGNRLRHPLMKNVMAAKKAVIGRWLATAPAPARGLHLDGIHPVTATPRSTRCEWLEGTAEQKAEALARVLAAAAKA